jgi:uncharacterized protein (TIGR03503 family)
VNSVDYEKADNIVNWVNMLKQVVSALIFCAFLTLSFSLRAIPQSPQEDTQLSNIQTSNIQDIQSSNNQDRQVDDSPLLLLGNKFQNGIELLQNRFRIDFEVDEITIIFFRKFGSKPIVLVRPDGSKLYQSSADDENIFWFDSTTFDMIRIKNPTPGPWQAIGQILPGSRVMVISDLVLHTDPLPQIIFSGEILKQTAYLTNNGVPIDYKAFKDVVELTFSLSSTNNPNYNNFGTKTEIIAYFEDNGKGMDERPLDGVFTGQFNLAIADGEWTPNFTVSTPMFSREQVDSNIMLLANPIKVFVELDGGGDGYHKLTVDAQREHVDMSTLLIDGKVRFPNGDIQNFSITDMSADIREYLIVNFEYGVYRVKLTTYGNTNEGREFILDVPEYSFLTEEPVLDTSVTESSLTNSESKQSINVEVETGESVISEQMMIDAEDEMSTSTLVSLIVGINLFMLIVGGGLIWWLTLDKKFFVNFKRNYKTPSDENAVAKKVGFFTKIFKRISKVTKAEKKSKDKTESDSGFIDLPGQKD